MYYTPQQLVTCYRNSRVKNVQGRHNNMTKPYLVKDVFYFLVWE